jgi:hypothetical protein
MKDCCGRLRTGATDPLQAFEDQARVIGLQRLLSVAIGRCIAGKRDKAEVQLGGWETPKRQLCEVQPPSSSGWTVSMFRLRLTRRAN